MTGGEREATSPEPAGAGASGGRRRISRLLDWNRLRHASVDERIQALRQLRQHSRQIEEEGGEGEPAAAPSHHRSSYRSSYRNSHSHHLAERLRERFHIGTPPPAERAASPTSPPPPPADGAA